MDARQERGLSLARSKRIRVSGQKWIVPSSQPETSVAYSVDPKAGTCSCPDFELRGIRCKHQWAVAYARHEVSAPDGSTFVVETLKLTYTQNWPEYNRAQMDEKAAVQGLLRSLCDGIAAPAPQGRGRPRLPLADAVHAAAMKVYSGLSGRRATTDVRECATKGLIDHAPHYNSIHNFMERPEVAPLLKALIEESASPLKAIERDFAVDSSGFSTNTYARWFDHKYGTEKRSQIWVKAHAMVGCQTNVIVSVEVTEGHVNDSPILAPLVQGAADRGFQLAEVSADKAYLGHDNLAIIEATGAVPYIPFKLNSKGEGSAAWRRLWHLYSLHREDFLAHYHKRSNVESTFSALKRKFGSSVRAKLPVAQRNEVLFKILLYNLACLVHSAYELGVDPTFWAGTPVAHQSAGVGHL